MAATVLSNVGGQVDLRIASGTDFGPVVLTFTNADGSAVNLTGCTLTAEIKNSPEDTDAVATFNATITNATEGLATLDLPYAQNQNLTVSGSTNPAGQYYWDMKLTDSNGLVSRPLYGSVLVFWDVTI